MTWFSGERAKMHRRIDAVEQSMSLYEKDQSEYSAQLRVLQAQRENDVMRLEEIQLTTRNTNAKVDNLAAQMTDILVEVKRSHRNGMRDIG